MSLINFDPFVHPSDLDRAFENWSRRMERMFRPFEQSTAIGTAGGNTSSALNAFAKQPAIDVVDTEKEVVVHTELPGMKKEDIKVEVVDNQLVVSGEAKTESKFEDHNYVRRERSFGTFRRVVGLPKNVDSHQISARFENGLLEVKLPKKQLEQAQRKTIAIN
jgi:HSP20 family protein